MTTFIKNSVYNLPSELYPQVETVLDKDSIIEERLEAFEDIIDSEVGDTTLVRARSIERESGIRQLFLKFEGNNPTGTQKDRIAFAQCHDALRRGYDALSVATCGNYGVSVSLAAKLAGLKCFVHIPEHYHTKRVTEMEELGANIIRTPGDYEKAVEISNDAAKVNDWYDANPGGANTPIQLKAYADIAYEIYDELRDAPKIVAVPVSNGTVLAGVYKGFSSLYRRGKTSRIPIMVAGSSYKKNPIVHSFLKNKDNYEDLQPENIKETIINEPLINWHSFDGDLALQAIRNTNGWAENISDKSMIDYARILSEKEGLKVLPASTAGLIAIIKHHQKASLENDRFVAILTGKNS
ncbi:pyridoxal-phosphate dependent enzyme [Chondrinema litorale]|uniref:pyridoxal-phosphate dependent enzyme n=1 Tax=Chondrinema litorale TaxID=2994555 RepID=UPI0025431256|nr:pyridoxal-phosphate dependent enzyme [Chondrinema litorale]UZR98618.1 pyridoxal-phosphate dependent enzyme [Chondrinema litorale]